MDDHDVVLVGLKALFAKHADLQVIGEASNGEIACAMALELQPDVVVMDLAMPRLNGIEATKKIKEQCPKVKISGLSVHEDRPFLTEFLRAGGSGFVPKRAAAEDIVTAVRVVAAGGMFVEPSLMNPELGRKEPNSPSQVLSEREGDVVRYVARGHTNKEIAVMLGVSIKTVETYKARSMAKLKAKNRSDLVKYALWKGWLATEGAPTEQSESE